MQYRDFDFADRPTAHNLHRLDHLSGQDYSLDERMLDDFIVTIVQTHKLLPTPIQRLISISGCYTMGRHWNTTQERRDSIWVDIRAGLNAGLDRVASQSTQFRHAVDTDRPKTRGERILELCKDFERGGNLVVIARKLQMEGAGSEVAHDAKQLLRLLERKRIPNMGQHEADIARLVYHMEIIAARLHHLP